VSTDNKTGNVRVTETRSCNHFCGGKAIRNLRYPA